MAATATTFQTTAVFDKASYDAGETMRVVITGGATATPDPTVVETPAAVDLRITAEDGSVTTIVGGPVAVRRTVPGVPVQITTKIQTVTDSSGRTWTVAADGRSATAIA